MSGPKSGTVSASVDVSLDVDVGFDGDGDLNMVPTVDGRKPRTSW
jgi:hypothetical protein